MLVGMLLSSVFCFHTRNRPVSEEIIYFKNLLDEFK